MIKQSFCLGLWLLVGILPVEADGIVGPISSIRDGDTFTIGDTSIRLCGIDAPENGEPGWLDAAHALQELTRDRTVHCVQVGNGTVCDGRSKPTNYNRIVAQCFVGDLDIAAYLAEAGLVCDWIRFSGGHYSADGKAERCP